METKRLGSVWPQSPRRRGFSVSHIHGHTFWFLFGNATGKRKGEPPDTEAHRRRPGDRWGSAHSRLSFVTEPQSFYSSRVQLVEEKFIPTVRAPPFEPKTSCLISKRRDLGREGGGGWGGTVTATSSGVPRWLDGGRVLVGRVQEADADTLTSVQRISVPVVPCVG